MPANSAPSIKYAAILEATSPSNMRDALAPLAGGATGEPVLYTTRLQPPICHWATYQWGPSQLVFKTLFQRAHYDSFVAQLEDYYPERIEDPGHLRGGLLLFPELQSVGWRFPFDSTMAQLHRCVDSDYLSPALELPAERIKVETLDYTPEIGAVFRYRAEPRGRVVAYGKAAPRSKAGLEFLVMHRLWNSEARRNGTLRVARPMAYRDDAGLLLQAPVPGKPLPDSRNRIRFLELVRTAAIFLAEIHSADIPFGQVRSVNRSIDHVQNTMDDLQFTAPDLYPAVDRFVRHLIHRTEASASSEPVPSHGDYKYDQLLSSPSGFSLIDFEMFCQAEPELDLGTFCAYLPASTPEDWRDGLAAEILRTTFLTTYEALRDYPIAMERLAVYESAAMALRGLAYVWRQPSDWEIRASAMIDLAIDRLMDPGLRAVDELPTFEPKLVGALGA